MRHPIRPWVLACLAAGVVGTAAPVPAVQAEPAEPAFGGYSAEATATPLKIEIYEPVLPIPAEPQAEVELAYTKVESASGPTGKGVASWAWPGDPIGQGCKTFVEQLGLGETGLCKDGYPIQVNSQTPGEPSEQSDEPVPGSLMRTSADAKDVRSTVGWSTNCDVSEGKKDEGGDQPGGDEPGGDLPGGELPELPETPVDPLGALGAAITGKDRVAAGEEEPQSKCQLPAQLTAVVDFDGLVSDAHTENLGKSVRSVAVSKIGNLSLLSGMITADSVAVRTETTADGKKPTSSGVTRITGLELAGTPITVSRDGVEVAGEKNPLPDLSGDPAKALEQLGVKLVLPKPQQSAKGDESSAVFEGLRIIIDTTPLRSYLNDVPFDEIIKNIPDEEGLEELKSLLGAATQLSPKFVITAGNAASETTTVPMMEFDLGDLPTVDAGDLAGAAAPPVSGSTGGTGVTAAGAAPALGEAAAAGDAGEVGALAAEPMSSGLPPLASIPGALTVGGLILAAGVGWWLQKIGGLVLGGAGSCTHGLETGVPDLRRA